MDKRVKFYGRRGLASFFFARNEVVYVFVQGKQEASPRKVSQLILGEDPVPQGEEKRQGCTVRIQFVGANRRSTVEGQQELPGKLHHFLGSDLTQWKRGLPTYGQVRYRELWPGIDLIYQGRGGKLKYEFLVKPGADPRQIRLAYRGIQGHKVSDAGDLILKTPLGELRDSHPYAYQEIGGKQVAVEANFRIEGTGRMGTTYSALIHGFEVENYDPAYPLVLDPGIDYATFLGGNAWDEGFGITLDSAGNAYVTGYVSSSDFPITDGAFDTSYDGFSRDAFLAKLSSDGSRLLYATFLGGSHDEWGLGIALDALGNIYLTGQTFSSDFPATDGAFDTSYNGAYDAFVAKLSSDGSRLLYATFLGGNEDDRGLGIAMDVSGNAYVTGQTSSSDFSTTDGAFDTGYNGHDDAFVVKLSNDGSHLLYATFLGGISRDFGWRIALDTLGNAYLTGQTFSSDFPATDGAFDTSYNGAYDAFVAKLSSDGSRLLYATFLGGGSGDEGRGIALDAAGNAYVTGWTWSRNFPTTAGAFDTSFNTPRDSSISDAFVAKLSSDGSRLLYATFLGGRDGDRSGGIALDAAGNAYVTGFTASPNFPTTAGAFDKNFNGEWDTFVAKLSSDGSRLLYATFLGGRNWDEGRGIALDAAGNAYVTGFTASPNFPTTAGAFDTSFNGNKDIFVARLRMKFWISGTIRNSQKIPIAGVMVEARDPKGTLMGRTLTDAQGGYRLELPPGRYTIESKAHGDFHHSLSQGGTPLRGAGTQPLAVSLSIRASLHRVHLRRRGRGKDELADGVAVRL